MRARTAVGGGLLAAGVLLPLSLPGQAVPRATRVEVMTPTPPIPVLADGKRVLVYELHITSFDRTPLALRRVEVYSTAAPSVPLASYQDSTLGTLLELVSGPPAAQAGARLDIGRRLIAYLWIELPPDVTVPTTLRHRLTFAILDTSVTTPSAIGESAIDSVLVPVARSPVPVLVPPMHGGEWLAGSGPSNTSDHRRSRIALDGKVYIAQRFAIDWVLVGKNGNTYHDDPHQNENFWAFGQPVHAVADGEVTEVADSIADNTPHTAPPPATLANIAGNHVIVRIAPHRYVLFAHLERGSVRVRLHQHVRQGDVLALLGNSGQATGPHLHFQVMDDNSPLASEGVPFVFDAFTFLGPGSDFEEDHHPMIPRRGEMPVEGAVIGFP